MRFDPGFEAERRHVTAVFCDLVGSTELGARLDAEDLHRVVGGFQGAAGRVVESFGGHVENRMGDGLVALFGYPVALEDAAERAVRAGLAVVAEVESDNDVLESRYGVRLSIRVGVHAGSVIVSSRRADDPAGQTLGHAMNVAARLQEVAQPGAVVLSGETARSAGAVIATREVGRVELRGVETPVDVLEAVGLNGAVASVGHWAQHSLPFVGRREELAQLRTSWQRVLDGEGQVVFIEGEAGYGKSRLVDQFSREISGIRHTWFECQCSSYTASSAYFPIIDVTRKLYGLGEDEEEGIRRLERDLERKRVPLREAVPLLTSWMSVPCPPEYPSLDLAPEAARRQTRRFLLESFRPAPQEPPEVWVVEDVQWADASTLELIEQFLVRFEKARALLVLTYRPQFDRRWERGPGRRELVLARMERSEARSIVDGVVGGRPLPAPTMDRILDRADGIPMFLEELTKAALHAGDAGAEFLVPERLQDSLHARLDRLGDLRRMVQVCAVLGREFSCRLVEQVVADGADTARSLQRLVEAEILSTGPEGGDTPYAFRQSLLQDCACESLLREQRQELHRRAAQALVRVHPERCREHPEILAHHHREAGDPDRAARAMAHASRRALETSAYSEAVAHALAGLADIAASDVSEDRRRLRLELQLALGLARNALHGFADPQVAEAYSAARALCEDLGAGEDLVETLYALWCAAAARGDRAETTMLAERVSSQARETSDLRSRLLGISAAGTTAVYVGAFEKATRHFARLFREANESGFRFEALVFGADPIVAAHTYQAWADWLRGLPDRALGQVDEGLRLARRLGQPFTLGWALSWAATVYGFRGETRAARSVALELCELAERHALGLWQSMGVFHRGNVSARLGDRERGLADMRTGLEAYRTSGARLFVPTMQALLAEQLLAQDRWAEGEAVVEEAIGLTASTIEAHTDAELYRLRGELRARGRVAGGDPAELAEALALARRQGALSIELRIVTTLSRWQFARGATGEARSLLSTVLEQFSEGESTSDFRAAEAWLAEMEEKLP